MTENQDGKQHMFYKLSVSKRVEGEKLVVNARAYSYYINEPTKVLSNVKGTDASKEVPMSLEQQAFVNHTRQAESDVRANAAGKLSKLLAVGAIEPGELLGENEEYPRVAPPIGGYQFVVRLTSKEDLGRLSRALTRAAVYGPRINLVSRDAEVVREVNRQILASL